MNIEAMTAVIYLRVSTKEQAEMGGMAEGFSIPGQREVCLRTAKSMGAQVIAEFVDRGESAKSADRPELQRMLAFVREQPVSFVIVHKIDRLARNRADDVNISLALKAAGTTLVSCTENIDDTPNGGLMHGIMSAFAEYYSRNLAAEVIKGSTQKAKSGGLPGKAPTGYLNHRIFEGGREIRTVIVDPERGPLMRQAFELYATGQWTTRTLLVELTSRGLTAAPQRDRPGRPLAASNLHRLLRHPFYKGVVLYRGVEYAGSHEPLVSEALWQQVQQVLDAQNYAGEKTRVHPHYLKGTVFCGSCKSRLIVHHARSKTGRIYPYFICLGKQQKRTSCTRRAVAIDVVEALVEQHYKKVQPLTVLTEEIRALVIEEFTRTRQAAGDEQETLKRRISRLEAERQKLLNAYYAEAIDTATLKIEQDRIQTGLTNARERLDALDVRFDRMEASLNQVLDLATDWYRIYLASKPKERRLMNQAIFARLYIMNDDTVEHELVQPFSTLLGQDLEREATKRYFRRTSREMAMIDEQWAELSAKWSAELAPVTEVSDMKNPQHVLRVRGSNVDCLVAGTGLEPVTSWL